MLDVLPADVWPDLPRRMHVLGRHFWPRRPSMDLAIHVESKLFSSCHSIGLCEIFPDKLCSRSVHALTDSRKGEREKERGRPL